MENSVENENPHFFAEGAAEAAGVAPCDGRRDGNIAEIRIGSSGRNWVRQMPRRDARTVALHSIGWKGQYIGGAFFATVGAIPAGHLGIVNQADDERAGGEAEAANGALEKFVEFSNRNTNATLAIEDHGDGVSRGDSCRRSCPRGSCRWAYRRCARRTP